MNKTRRKLIIASTAVAVTGLFGLGATSHKVIGKRTTSNANARLGMNLAGIADWGTEFPLIDLFKQSRRWFVEGKSYENSGLKLDAEGWVIELPKNVVASTIISSLEGGHFPGGEYIVLYEGEGVIKIPNYYTKATGAGRLEVQVDGHKGLFQLNIHKSNPKNYIRNIRVVLKEDEDIYQKGNWRSSFLKRWSGVACLRFMDFMQTNNSFQNAWESRAKLTDASFASNGVPVEMLVDLANRLNCDAWFCMPHQADDGYVKEFAQYVAQNLKPELRAWVEYSNEVWNGAFNQHHYATKAGLNLEVSGKSWESASKYYAYRSVQIFNLWENVFGGTQRLVRVLASQAVYTKVAKQILSYKLPNNKLAAEYADVLAIANYVDLSVSPIEENGLNSNIVTGWALDKLFDYLNYIVLPKSEIWLNDNKKIADKYGLKLVSYEAGQHLIGIGESVDNKRLTELFMQANSDVRMGKVYEKSLDIWKQVGGDLICIYCSMGSWSQWGSWGLLEYADKPTPKYKAVINWAKSRGQKMLFLPE